MYLNCHSYYSLRYGTMAPETLVEEAAKLGIGTLVLTDINNSTGMVDFVKACGEHGVDPVAGMELREGDRHLYTGIARNPKGFRALNEFLSYHNETGIPLPHRAPPLDEVWFVYDFRDNPWDRYRKEGRRGRPPKTGPTVSQRTRSSEASSVTRSPAFSN